MDTYDGFHMDAPSPMTPLTVIILTLCLITISETYYYLDSKERKPKKKKVEKVLEAPPKIKEIDWNKRLNDGEKK
tara:strand:+ start:34 stop:258 length:225 start_codon:yes stop_codon:yes gene_type:complete